MASTSRRRPVLLYDGTCGFCRKCVALIAYLDRSDQVARLNAHSEAAQSLVTTISPTRRHQTLHLLDISGRVLHGGPAASRALEELGGDWGWLQLLALLPRHAIDLTYPVIAARRTILGALLAWAPAPPNDNFRRSDWPLLIPSERRQTIARM